MVKDIWPGFGDSWPRSLTVSNGLVFFRADDGAHGDELWKSDGTEAGTVLVKDTNTTGNLGSTPRGFTSAGGSIYFTAYDSAFTWDLWRTNGTADTTTRVADVQRLNRPINPDSFVDVGGTVFFTAWDEQHGQELWKSDGTDEGTLIVPGTNHASPRHLTSYAGNLYFAAHGDLWRSDGTEAGTVFVTDIWIRTYGEYISEFTELNGLLYFLASHPRVGHALWQTDGTDAGTVQVKHLGADDLAYRSVHQLVRFEDELLFVVYGAGQTAELWKSDGSETGTIRLADLPGSSNSPPREFTVVNERVFFLTATQDREYQIWISDGSSSGTALVAALPGLQSDPRAAGAGGLFYVSAADEFGGRELWKSDGTPAGTHRVKDIWPGTDSSFPSEMVGGQGFVFFAANDGASGIELWSSDGSEAGTQLVADINPTGSSNPSDLTFIDGTLYFSADDGVRGKELWKLDVSSTIVGRHVFYNNSVFDGGDPAAGAADDGAIAPDKTALLPGQTAGFANYTSYNRGINGVMIDVAGLWGTPTVDDFTFKLGNNNAPDGWTPAPPPAEITVRTGAGVGGSDRVTLVWPDGAIKNTWLEVTMLHGGLTGLAAPDVFYFGNAIGETGNATNAQVSFADEALTRLNGRSAVNPAPIDFRYDFNRDGLVDAADQVLARLNATNAFSALRLIAVPVESSPLGPREVNNAARATAGLSSAALSPIDSATLASQSGRRRRR
jgi:ELWxxDGT repeat protein